MNNPHLSFEKIKYLAIKEKILADNPDIDDQTLADTVEGLSDLPDKLAAILRDGLEAETMEMALRIRIEQMTERAERFENRAERLRALVRDVMIDADIRKLQMPDFTASLRDAPPHVVVTNEDAIDERFFETRRHLKKRELLEALKQSELIEGATLSNATTVLNVRTR